MAEIKEHGKPQYGRIPLSGGAKKPKNEPLKVREISDHITNVSPEGYKMLKKVLPEGSLTLKAYKDALAVRRAIERDHNSITEFSVSDLKDNLNNPFVGMIKTLDPKGNVVTGQTAYAIVKNALELSQKGERIKQEIEPTIRDMKKQAPWGIPKETWNRMVDKLKKELISQKLHE